MPGLMDFYGGGGNLFDTIGNNRNSLIGLGMGMLAPSYPLRGESPWTNAMQGFQSGAGLDSQNQYRQYQMRQAAEDRKRQAERDRISDDRWRQNFEQERDIANRPKIVEGPGGFYRVDPRTGMAMDSGAPTQSGYGEVGAQYGPRPVIPAAPKALSPHEMGAIEKADDAAAAFKGVSDNLDYAKSISKNAPSGLFAPLSDRVGQAMPEYMSEQTKNRLLLQNAITSNAVEQLRAIFGGNPTEGERKVLIDLQGSINAPDEVRQEIFDRAKRLAGERMERNQQRSQGIRNRTYYQPGGGQGGFGPSGGGGGWTDVGDGIKVRPK